MKKISPEEENGKPSIRYSEFISATLDIRKHLTKEKLWSLFRYFDTKNDGYISAEDLKEIF